MRQSAWLNTPKRKPDSDRSNSPAISRREEMEQNGVEPQLPDCINQYLLGYLAEIGPTIDGNPITHAEIQSWKANTGAELTFWEAITLHQLSRDYASQSYKSIERDCPAPYAIDIEDQREIVENKFRSFMSQSKVTRE